MIYRKPPCRLDGERAMVRLDCTGSCWRTAMTGRQAYRKQTMDIVLLRNHVDPVMPRMKWAKRGIGLGHRRLGLGRELWTEPFLVSLPTAAGKTSRWRCGFRGERFAFAAADRIAAELLRPP